ncbi:MAG TPA: hypothetical protein RWO09_03090 [Ruminococcus sp.]
MRILIRYDKDSENDLARAGVTLGKLAIVFGAVSIEYAPRLVRSRYQKGYDYGYYKIHSSRQG